MIDEIKLILMDDDMLQGEPCTLTPEEESTCAELLEALRKRFKDQNIPRTIYTTTGPPLSKEELDNWVINQ